MPDHVATALPAPDRTLGREVTPATWRELQIVRRFRAMNTHIDLYATHPRDAAANIPEVKNNTSQIKVGDPVLANATTSPKVVA